jgi:hypothetical protein
MDYKMDYKMEKLNKLANAITNAPNLEMKKIWTDKWYQLVKQYAMEVKAMEVKCD